MAPELKKLKRNINGDEYVDEIAMADGCKADIYSLGITLIYLVHSKAKK